MERAELNEHDSDDNANHSDRNKSHDKDTSVTHYGLFDNWGNAAELFTGGCAFDCELPWEMGIASEIKGAALVETVASGHIELEFGAIFADNSFVELETGHGNVFAG